MAARPGDHRACGRLQGDGRARDRRKRLALQLARQGEGPRRLVDQPDARRRRPRSHGRRAHRRAVRLAGRRPRRRAARPHPRRARRLRLGTCDPRASRRAAAEGGSSGGNGAGARAPRIARRRHRRSWPHLGRGARRFQRGPRPGARGHVRAGGGRRIDRSDGFVRRGGDRQLHRAFLGVAGPRGARRARRLSRPGAARGRGRGRPSRANRHDGRRAARDPTCRQVGSWRPDGKLRRGARLRRRRTRRRF